MLSLSREEYGIGHFVEITKGHDLSNLVSNVPGSIRSQRPNSLHIGNTLKQGILIEGEAQYISPPNRGK
jgi:hypothetical protein